MWQMTTSFSHVGSEVGSNLFVFFQIDLLILYRIQDMNMRNEIFRVLHISDASSGLHHSDDVMALPARITRILI